MSDIRDLYKLVTELEQSYDENTMYVGDAFDIELSEHFLIETSIAGFTNDGVILESDSEMLEFFDIHDIRLDEGVKDKLVAAMMAAGIAAGGAGLYHSDQQAFKASDQLQQLHQFYDRAKAEGDEEMMRQLKQRIRNHKARISGGQGDIRDRDGNIAQLHYDRTLSRSDLNESRDESLVQIIIHRIVHQHLDLLREYGPESVSLAIEDQVDFIPDDLEEIGSSDVGGWVRQIEDRLERGGYDTMNEASVVSLNDNPTTLKRLAKQWWTGYEQQYAKAQQMLNKMGWDIYEDEDDVILSKDGQEDIIFSMDELEGVSAKVSEAEYQGRKVTLNKPMPNPEGKSKSKVYVKDGDKVKKVTFGDPNMRIRKSNPEARKSFRARHNCDNPGPKTKARYWSCRAW